MIDKKNKRVISVIIIIMIMVSIYLIINIFNIFKSAGGNPKDIVYNIEIENKNDNKVYLKPNSYIAINPTPDSLSYISSLVDYIKTSFKYQYKGNRNIDMNYLYNIKATVIGEYVGEKSELITRPVWQQEFVLLNDKKGDFSGKGMSISKSLNIDLNYYNDLVTNFQSTLSVPIDARLEVKLSITLDGSLIDTYPVKKEYYMLTTIPLGVKAFDITTSNNFVNNEKIYNKEPRKLEIIYALIIIYIIGLIGINLLGIYFIKKVTDKTKNKYDFTIKRILKGYGDRIVTIDNFINDQNLDIIDVANFNEIINLADETLEPILFWEKKNKKGREGWFAVLRNKVIYRFIYKEQKMSS